MSTPQNVLIIGGGLAGAKTAEALRESGFEGSVMLIAGEDHLPYERPPLSKEYLAGKAEFDKALVHPAQWYEENNVTLRQGARATSIDAAGHKVTVDAGGATETLDYDKLVLATGSTVRKLPLPGADANNVHYLRTVEDSDAIRSTFGEGKKLAIIGGGWIGLEVASAARGAGTDVTVLEGGKLPLLKILGEKVAQVFADLHIANGVDLRTEVKITEIVTEDGQAVGVRLEDGDAVPADAVVIGIGVTPVVDLAETAGLDIDNGVLVDATLRTSDPDIYAVGDIANHDHPVLGHRIRVEHWATALNQPAAAVKSLLGQATEFTNLPYFFTDQFDLGCEYVGHATGSQEQVVIRGDLNTREFVAFWIDENSTILAAMNVNVWDVLDDIKPLIAEGKKIDPKKLEDPTIPFSQV
ncbi:uncharacterized NAD(FAD)-dependent dehydrogenase [Corynebacterium suranareeae]|uniref:Uncharacterized NAD(FAD)-dependent dehydrogenase n=1 Tax=Corynebacterium suranareeae TaxID=2506452 RepID=A0A160PTH1_9CORY|nr:FAD-dependent oxidoreductase [Corynebacterium suranareeae]BAU97055.1 uncharacterized NAD(FAD)-dependent dehydrogenase [Corynebacterium suranareeae]